MTISSVLIVGSTSTIAKSISLLLAEKGCKKFCLFARNEIENNLHANKLINKYNVEAKTFFIDLEKNESILPFEVLEAKFDLILICAGYIGNKRLFVDNPKEVNKITNINYAAIIPFLVHFTSEERLNYPSRLWVISSVAGDLGKPSNYPYGAAKAALSIFSEGILMRCHNKPFSVRIIKAGYMDTKMASEAPKILKPSPSKVARNLLRHPNKRGIEYLPWWWFIIMKLVRVLPISIAKKL